jgi:hypothetical protein
MNIDEEDDGIIIMENDQEQIDMNNEAMIEENEEETNYITEDEQEQSENESIQNDELDVHIDTEAEEDNTGIEEEDIMNEVNEQETNQNDTENTNNMSSRPRQQNKGAGVERLELGHGTKEYASIANKHFLTVKGTKIGSRERRAKESTCRSGLYFWLKLSEHDKK